MPTSITKDLLGTKMAEYNKIYQTIIWWWIWKQQCDSSRIIKTISDNVNFIDTKCTHLLAM